MNRQIRIILMAGVLVALGTASMASAAYTIQQVTNNTTKDETPCISNNGDIGWVGGPTGWEIMVLEKGGTTPKRLTTDTVVDYQPQINANGDVIWSRFVNAIVDFDIFLYSKSTGVIKAISPPDVPSVLDYDEFPVINDSAQAAWETHDVLDWEIMFYNGTTSGQVSNNTYTDDHPRINNKGDIVWTAMVGGAESEIMLKDGATGVVTQLTNNTYLDNSPSINDTGDIVWAGWDGTDMEIFHYERATGKTTKLTDNTYDDLEPQSNNSGKICWEADVSTSYAEIICRNGLAGINAVISSTPNHLFCFCLGQSGWVIWGADAGNPLRNNDIWVHDGTTLMRLTTDLFDDTNPRININNDAVWQHWDGTDYEIYTAALGQAELCVGKLCPDDGNFCTVEYCDPADGFCKTSANTCDDGNPCSVDSCDPVSGCIFTSVVCGLEEFCDPATGTCVCMTSQLTLRGGGQKPTTADLQIQVAFAVMGGGCITSSSVSSVTVTSGTVLAINAKVGNGPPPSSAILDGAAIDPNMPKILTVTGAHSLVLDNKGNGGKDTDRITISVAY